MNIYYNYVTSCFYPFDRFLFYLRWVFFLFRYSLEMKQIRKSLDASYIMQKNPMQNRKCPSEFENTFLDATFVLYTNE